MFQTTNQILLANTYPYIYIYMCWLNIYESPSKTPSDPMFFFYFLPGLVTKISEILGTMTQTWQQHVQHLLYQLWEVPERALRAT